MFPQDTLARIGTAEPAGRRQLGQNLAMGAGAGESEAVQCVFCQVVAGQVKARIIEWTSDAVTLLDLRQPRAGHCLVIPTTHVENVFELDPDTGAALMAATVRAARAVRAAFSPEGLSLWQSNGPAAFQEVPHVHMHVMPRWNADELLRIYPRRLEPRPEAEMDAQVEQIRAQLG